MDIIEDGLKLQLQYERLYTSAERSLEAIIFRLDSLEVG